MEKHTVRAAVLATRPQASAQLGDVIQRLLPGSEIIRGEDFPPSAGDLQLILVEKDLFLARAPFPSPAPVVVFGDEVSPEVLRQAMMRGASDYLTWPVSLPDLRQALSDLNLLPKEEAGHPGFLFFAGIKGGVGKSFLALNTAILAGRLRGEPTLLLDLDLDGGSLHHYLKLPAATTLKDLLQGPKTPQPPELLQEAAQKVPGLPLALYPSPEILGLWETQEDHRLLWVLEQLQAAFPRGIVDLPAIWDNRTAALLHDAAKIVLVFPAAASSLPLAARWLRRLREEGLGERVFLVANRHQPDMRLTPRAMAEALGRRIDIQLPYDGEALPSLEQGRPLAGRRQLPALVQNLRPLVEWAWPQLGAAKAERRVKDVPAIPGDLEPNLHPHAPRV